MTDNLKDDVSQLMEDLLCQVSIDELDNIIGNSIEIGKPSTLSETGSSFVASDSLDDCVSTIQCLLDSLGTNNDNCKDSLSKDSQVLNFKSPVADSEFWKFSDDDSGVGISPQEDLTDSNNSCIKESERCGSPDISPTHNIIPDSNGNICGGSKNTTKMERSSTPRSIDEAKFYESLFENAVPVGWLNTLTHRKCRNYSTLTKSQSRKQDFVYCGPAQVSSDSCSTGRYNVIYIYIYE